MAVGNVIPYTTNMTDPVVSGGIDLDSDTIVCVLLSASYTPGRTTHSLWSDVSTYEITGTGYTAGGAALAGKAVTHSSGTGKFDADDVSWTTATITAKYAVLVRRAGGSLVSGDLLIGYLDLNTDSGSATASSTASTFTVQWNAAGIMTLTGNSS
jgi:hypothetical protein